MIDVRSLCLQPSATLRDVLVRLNDTAKGIVLVVDAERRLLSTITDGDVRRAMLHGFDQGLTLQAWMDHRALEGKSQPRTAPVGTGTADLLRLMHGGIRHIPLLDECGRVVDVALLSDLVEQAEPALSAVIMAGGFGSRLQPLTLDVPKPMLQIGDKPVIEHIITGLRDAGIHHVHVTTHYRAEAITSHLGDGRRLGLSIDYLNEDDPLGTAGALGLMPAWESTLLVINGDILTRLNYQSMLSFHRENDAVMTVGVRRYEIEVPYGVVHTEGVQIARLSEKPVLSWFVNAGVYLLEPAVAAYLSPGQRCDMTDLIPRVIADRRRVVSFPISEYWIDIGRHDQFEEAQAAFAIVGPG